MLEMIATMVLSGLTEPDYSVETFVGHDSGEVAWSGLLLAEYSSNNGNDLQEFKYTFVNSEESDISIFNFSISDTASWNVEVAPGDTAEFLLYRPLNSYEGYQLTEAVLYNADANSYDFFNTIAPITQQIPSPGVLAGIAPLLLGSRRRR
jgi:hypothetical protein